MTTDFTTDNIDRLNASPLEGLRGWEITFRSANEGMHHQLYANGRLADWTESPAQRRFVLDIEEAPRQVAIAAVSAANRAVDMSAHLPQGVRQPAWVHRLRVVRSIQHRPGSRLAVLGDHATGQMDPTPLVVLDLWPAWAPRWAWGEYPFGMGGFGHGGTGAPGFGKGGFGAGSFGMDADLLRIDVPLAEEGTHRIVLRTLGPDGRSADSAAQEVTATPPPAPATSLSATQYDPQAGKLTLQIE
jgi:hypothetical protein